MWCSLRFEPVKKDDAISICPSGTFSFQARYR
jgi:hypothetical protein